MFATKKGGGSVGEMGFCATPSPRSTFLPAFRCRETPPSLEGNPFHG